MRVLALDPGERVGWARADVDELGAWTDLRHGITPLREMALALHRALTPEEGFQPQRDYDLVIVEDWRLRADKAREFAGSRFPAVQFIGMVRLCAWVSGVEVVMQPPRIKTPADKTLAALNPELYEKVTRPLKHDDAHDLDAIRHLWFWTWDTRISTRQPQEAV